MLHIWELGITNTGLESPDSKIIVLFPEPHADSRCVYYAYWDDKLWQVLWQIRDVGITIEYKWVHGVYVEADILTRDTVIRLAPAHILKNRFYA